MMRDFCLGITVPHPAKEQPILAWPFGEKGAVSSGVTQA
jgi:hypothetical protein